MRNFFKWAERRQAKAQKNPPAPVKTKAIEPLAFLDGFLTGALSAGDKLGLLQCGANDGMTVDPVRSFILRNPSTVNCVLVEPLPDIYAALQTNYANQDHVTTLNIAIGPDDTIKLYRIKPEYSDQYRGIIASGITSFDREFVLQKATRQLKIEGVPPESRIESITQQCQTISQVIDAHAAALGTAPFVQIDAEGFDDTVVYTIDFERHQPIAINYEVDNLTEDKHLKLRAYLAERGYYFIRWTHSDELAIRN